MTQKFEFNLNEYGYTTRYDTTAEAFIITLTKKKSLPLAGKYVVLTGVLSSFDRAEAEKLVVKMGGIIVNSVKPSTKVDYVVLGINPGIKNNKLNYSLANGAKIVNDKDFISMVAKFRQNG